VGENKPFRPSAQVSRWKSSKQLLSLRRCELLNLASPRQLKILEVKSGAYSAPDKRKSAALLRGSSEPGIRRHNRLELLPCQKVMPQLNHRVPIVIEHVHLKRAPCVKVPHFV
jgi:hypothetical protein